MTTDPLEVAVQYLAAERHENGFDWTYIEPNTRSRMKSSTGSLETLGRRLLSGHIDIYARWAREVA